MVSQMKKIIFCIVSSCFVILAYIGIRQYFERKNDEIMVPVSDNNFYAYDIEEVLCDSRKITINGWFFALEGVRNEVVTVDNSLTYRLALLDVSKQKNMNAEGATKSIHGVVTPMRKTCRNDVNLYFDCEYDYSNSGFSVSFPKSKIDEMSIYRIYIKISDKNNDAIATNVYLHDNKLFRVNPDEVEGLVAETKELESLIYEGTVVVARPDVGIYVVQRGSRLFWLADEFFIFDEDASTRMEYQVETTQFSKLPLERIENGWFWGNEGCSFETYEISDTGNWGKYRVMVQDIPTEYSVTHICLGYNDGEKWIWKEEIKPVYKDLLKTAEY